MTTAPDDAARQEALLRLARKRRAETPAADAGATASAADESGPVPLSYAQRRMWLMDRLGQGGARYHVPFAARLRGPLDVDALSRALTALTERHEVLRTRYGQHDGEPYQEIDAPAPVPVQVVDAAEDVGRQLYEAAARPFDLATGPVLRALAVRHAPQDHTVVLTLHHIAIDGGSLDVVGRELGALYRAAADGGAPTGLDGPAPRYRDYARREQADAAALENGLEYWLTRLAGARPVPLPAPSAQTGAVPRGQGRVLAEPLSPAVLDGLRATGAQHRATLFMVVLAGAFATLLDATGREDLVLGCASSHRDRPGLRDLVGLCVNTLPVRAELTGAEDFGELLARVRDAMLEAQLHRDVPFDLIVERLGGAARDRDGNPLLSVTADVLREPVALRLPGTESEAVDIDLGTAKFDLGFYIEEARDGLAPRCLVQYDRARLDEEAAHRLLRTFATLLTEVAADPGRPLSRPQRVAPDPAPVHPAEALLLARPEVAEAVLLERTGRPPLAYVVPGPAGAPVPEELRIALRSRLAPEQVPAAVTVLDALPRTADGAVDLGRLPGAPRDAEVPLGARGPAVLEAFGALLGEEPAPDADFFLLGGHSLLAVRLAERLRERFRLPLTGLDVMEHRTPRALTALLDARAREREAAAPRAVRRAAARPGTVLVTGATGGVGAFVLRELAARGRPVRALVRPESAHLVAADGVEVAEGDLGDLDSLRAAVAGAESVIHSACTFTSPEVDLAAMRALLDGWRQGTFVFVSSVDAYGQPPVADVAEDTAPAEPFTGYGRAKLDCERLVLAAAGQEGRGGASVLRAPIVWGPHARLRDQLRWGATGELYQAALAGAPIELPSPELGWYGAPWVHAAALARALAHCAERPVDGVVNAVGGHVEWHAFAAELVRLLGSGSEIRHTADAAPGALELLHRRRYRAGTLAAELAERPGEDWRSVIAAMLGSVTPGNG
ncbi:MULTISPECIES: condensation domain-containing protein [Streptomyces]|uniref:condensation domain-containing protein n=1 Tax=Streptomyces TaxID=1883 RepID=UPI000B9EEC5D|nr:condensation domain-containing protein [Streptomyces kasugaensis]